MIIGEGPDAAKVRAKAGPNVSLLGYQPAAAMADHMRRAKALIFAADEDFGIVPVEAQACGKPVIAYGRGGVTESVKGAYPDQEITSNHTGIFFYPQTKEALMDAVQRFESVQFDPERVRENVLRFDRKIFKEKIEEFIEVKFAEYQSKIIID